MPKAPGEEGPLAFSHVEVLGSGRSRVPGSLLSHLLCPLRIGLHEPHRERHVGGTFLVLYKVYFVTTQSSQMNISIFLFLLTHLFLI